MEVVAYDEAWPAAFVRERDALVPLLGPACAAIHHVGSTSVSGLCAASSAGRYNP